MRYIIINPPLYSSNEGTVDSSHPTDFGFALIAHALIKIMKNIKLS